MKVLLIDVSFFLGGDQKNFIDLCSSLHIRGGVELAAAVNAGPLMDALIALGIQTYPLNMRFQPTHKRGVLSRLASLFHTPTPISQVIADFNPDIVHANTFESAKMIPSLPARRLLFWQVSNLRLSRTDTLSIATRCNRILAGSTALDEFLGEVLPAAYCGRVRIIHNGIDTQVYKPGDKVAARKAFALPLEVPVIGFLADLIPWKRHGFFLEVAKRILEQNPAVHFVVAGRSYSSQYERYEKAFQEALSSFVAPEQIHWLRNVNNSEALLPAFDLLIHTAYGESSGRAVCEAMAMQVPIIAFESGAIRDLITNRKDGILIRSDDANEFAREALGLLANPGQAAALASSARETIQKEYSKEDMCQRMIGEYKSAIDAELNHNT
jgi:glycosyltransferase involved in cell wall biosynthesis